MVLFQAKISIRQLQLQSIIFIVYRNSKLF